MIKGHVQIDIHNHNSGFTERIEGDNLITNAMQHLIPNMIGGGKSISNIMPLCKRLLGGVMLFDAELEANVDNIFFPGTAHLVASAGQTTNISDAFSGSLNASETYETDTGFVTTWDFGTSQANGTLRSLARTLADPSNYTIPFSGFDNNGGAMHGAVRNSDGSSSCYIQPLCYDLEKQYLYFIGITDGNSQTSRYDSSERAYYYTTHCTIYREYIPTSLYALADVYNRATIPEEITSFDIEMKEDNTNIAYKFFNGYDGYAYMLQVPANSTGDGSFTYRTLKLSDYSFELSDPITVTARSCHFSNRWEHVSRGKAYIRSYDMKSIYIINLANPVDILQATLPEGYTFTTNELTTLKNGGVKFRVYSIRPGTTSNYDYRMGICYPDSKIIIDSAINNNYYYTDIFQSENLMLWGCANNYSSHMYSGYGYTANNYLGSIFNFGSPIVKTAASSMKVVYTLTNVDE